jgi:hypothetical protein
MADRSRQKLRRMICSVVAVGIALLAVACGGGGSPPASAALTAYQKELAFSQCMRAHGESGFPDPQPNGSILVGPQDHLAQGSPQFAAANKACQHLLPPSRPMTAAQQRQLTQKLLKWVACLRSHGAPDMPDPQVNAQGVEFHGPPGGPNAPQFKAAQQACRKLLPGGLA